MARATTKRAGKRTAKVAGTGTGKAVRSPSAPTSKAEVEKRKRKLASRRREPNSEALKLAVNLGSRRQRDCAIRKTFSRREKSSDATPVLARLVGKEAGRAAEPRVKLALTLLWLARDDGDWTIQKVPAATMALLFGLEDPEKLGAARVTGAIRALADSGIAKASQQRGREPRILVQHEKGKGKWTSPVGAEGQAHAKKDLYCQLDAGFWANGWISVLSSRAVAALVILLDATWERNAVKKKPVKNEDGLTFDRTLALDWWHITDEALSEQYGVSRDLFDRGINELMAWDLVEMKKRAIVDRTMWGERRWYRMLRVRLEVLRTPVIDVWNGKTVRRVPPRGESGLGLLTDEEIEELLGLVKS